MQKLDINIEEAGEEVKEPKFDFQHTITIIIRNHPRHNQGRHS